MTDLITRLLALAEKAVDEALQLDYGDPEDRYIYRELQELKQLVQQQADGPTDEELLRCYGLAKRNHCYEGPMDDWPKRAERAATVCGLRAVIAADRARWGRPSIEPVPVSERLPGPEDCDESYQCWQWDARSDSWTLYTSIGMGLNPLSTHWLPYHALPLPAK